MLASVLRSDTAIEINISIIRAFVSIRQLILNPNPTEDLKKRISKLEAYVNDILIDQNEINEDTNMQLELINEALSQLQTIKTKSRPRIGYINYEE